MKAVQDGSQVLGLPSSAFFSAIGVGGVGFVTGVCGVVLVGCGVERVQAVSIRRLQRAMIRGMRKAFRAGPVQYGAAGGSMLNLRKAYPKG